MGIFKTIVSTIKTINAAKNVCCKETEKLMVDLKVKLDEKNKEQAIELEQKYKEIFEKYKKSNNSFDCIFYMNCMHIDLTKEEYEKRKEIYNSRIKQAIIEVDSGKLTYCDFFNIAYGSK